MTAIKDVLVKVVQHMVKAIDNIPRPDTQIANPEKTHLWMIDPKDDIVKKAENEVNEILLENLTIAAKAVNVYDDYLFILKEPERVAEFTSNPIRKREEYIERIQLYLNTIKKIKDEAPYEIRMSMFLIQCHELNNHLVHACEKLIDTIVKKMFDTNSEEASLIIGEVKRIQEAFTNKTEKSEELVQFEEYLDEVRNKKRIEIVNRYSDLIQWVQLMYEYPQFEVGDDIYKTVKTAYSSVKRIND